MFPEVHAPVEHNFYLFAAEAANSVRLFDTLNRPPLHKQGRAIFRNTMNKYGDNGV